MADHERENIEREIVRARDGVGDRIDELDRKLRTTLDLRSFASQHAPQLVAGGAVVGFLVGFGFSKPLRRVVQLGAPLALIAFKMIKARKNGAHADAEV
jgi:hypothetical protein